MDKFFKIDDLDLDQCALVLTAGGHPRSLEYVQKTMQSSVQRNFQNLLEDVVSELTAMYTERKEYSIGSEHFLRPVILQSKLYLYQKLNAKCNLYFEDAVSNGIYFNPFAAGIPRMAPILLLFYLEKFDSNLEHQLIDCILGIENRQFGGENFEIFHGVWEALFRSLYNKQYINMKESYKSSKVITSPKFQDTGLDVQDKYHLYLRRALLKMIV